MKSITNSLERISWIDICRGIGILLVMYGHVLSSDKNRFFIYAFHMPLFFFLSGMVFKYNRNEKFRRYILKNSKQILIPYLIFSFATYAIWIIFIQPHYPSNVFDELGGILRGNGHYPNLEFNSPLWFLPCLFAIKIMYAGITHFLHKRRYIYISLTVLSLAGYYLSLHFFDSNTPFSLDIALTAIVFFGMGHLWKSHSTVIEYCKRYALLLLPFALICTYIFAVLNFQTYGFQIDMRVNRLNNYFYFYIAAFSGIISMIALSYLIRHNALLEYIGKRTMILFAWHYIIFLCLTKITDAMPVDFSNVKIFFPTAYTIVAICIVFGANMFIKKINAIVSSK